MNIKLSEAVILDNLYINIQLGLDVFEQILQRFGKAGWNAYARKLRQHNIWAMYSTPEPTEDDDHCMPVCIEIDWRGLSLQKRDLSGLDLTIPMMEGCNFNGADLSGSQIGGVDGATFRGADLRDAKFEGSITGCDFSNANVSGASFGGAMFHPERPPISLPANELDCCHKVPQHWEVDEKAEDCPRCQVAVKSAELRSFWGELK